MRRVLVISYYWPPTGGSGVQRWIKFCKFLPSEGWQPVVYTPLNPEQLAVDESLLEEIPSEVEVLKTEIHEPYELYRKLTGGKGKAEINPANAQKKSWKQKAALLARGNLFIPDPRVSWVRPSVKFLIEYLKGHPVDAIVTTGPPQSMHLIGRDLRRAMKRRGMAVPQWIVDFRDPWTDLFYFKHLGLLPPAEQMHRHLEQTVLDECDKVIAVTPAVQKDFQARTSTPVVLITNGYDEDDFRGGLPDGPKKFTLVHTGLFAADGNPVALWNVLSEKCTADSRFRESLTIRLAGKVDKQIYDSLEYYGLSANTVRLGYLEHSATVEEQRRSSLLLLPLRQEPEYAKVYPGKIFEYLASQRPILGIGQPDSVSAALLRETLAGDMFDWHDEESLRAFIDREWMNHLCSEDPAPRADITRFSRRALTRQLVSVLKKD